MKNISLLSFLIFLGAFPLKSQVLNNNNIIADTTWSTDTIRIYNDVTVQYPATLTINPGVYVEFQGNYSINVQGSIKAIGTMNDTIVFTVFDTTSYADTATLAGGWGSIKLLDNPTDTSEFSFCRFSYGKAIDPGHTINDHLNEENWGGALFVKNYGNVFCSNSNFYNNRANFAGGAFWVKYCSSLQLINNSFIKNQTFQQGGGASIGNCSSAIISNNLFKLNKAFVTFETSVGTAVRGSGGGLRVNTNCNALVVNNKFFNNHSVNGSGLYETTSNCMIYNNVIANNMGNGIMNGHGFSTSTYANNTIVNNLAYSHTGCGIVYSSIFLEMRNNIIWGNDVIPEWNFDPIQLYNTDGSIADFTYMCNPDGYPGEGNITDDPLFVNPTAGAGPDYDGLSADWSLLDSSPCVNTGTPDITELNLPETDILGNPRVYGIRIDMGAIENQMVVGLPKNPLVNARLEISPNPFGQSFKVVSPRGQKISSISLYNQNGKPLGKLEKLPFDQVMVYDLANHPAGLYLMVTQFENGNTESTKLVKY
ncbi:MAG: right-handed parallel beta-helix repeat-containing protein [Bacteroidales bacterium]|nr:right-handed parallel beta-helix repeat-containing protein [Bacteroidales bacterium]